MASATQTYTGGLKKTEAVWISEKTELNAFELDEIFWFIAERKGSENGVNAYVMTMISRKPRQIIAFDVDKTKAQSIIQRMVDNSPAADNYYTDGYFGYGEIAFPGYHYSNPINKNDTHLVESINADLRHYIPGLRRRSRIFYRTFETFAAVLAIFVDAYNKYGERKMLYRSKYPNRKGALPFNIFEFI